MHKPFELSLKYLNLLPECVFFALDFFPESTACLHLYLIVPPQHPDIPLQLLILGGECLLLLEEPVQGPL